jgi:Uma2 family endonuclease
LHRNSAQHQQPCERFIVNFDVAVEVGIWNKQTKLGKGFDSSSGFKLPNGAERSPDVSWIKQERWDALTSEEQNKFAPICPDFVVEIRSASDTLFRKSRNAFR